MKTLFIPTKYTGKIDLKKIDLDKLPNKFGIITTAQFLDRIDEVIEFLKNNNKEVLIGKDKQRFPGQVLGCDVGAAVKIKDNVDAFLYVGSGEFHPIGVAMQTKKEVYTFNPVSSIFSKLDNEEIKEYEKRKKIKYTKFLHAENIGILVSTKPGQYSYNKAKELKDKLEKKGKKCSIFIFDALDPNELVNFSSIDFWINTACPRIADNKDKKNMIDMADLIKFE